MDAEISHLVLAFVAGAALGAFYFGGLWLTVRRMPTSPRPLLLTLGSFVTRAAVAVVVMFFILKIHWQLLAACMVGFLLARMVLVRKLGRARAEVAEREPEAPSGEPEAPSGEPDAPRGEPDVSRGEPEAPRGEPDVPRGEPEAPRGEPEASGCLEPPQAE